jgi:hypothetical protein
MLSEDDALNKNPGLTVQVLAAKERDHLPEITDLAPSLLVHSNGMNLLRSSLISLL